MHCMSVAFVIPCRVKERRRKCLPSQSKPVLFKYFTEEGAVNLLYLRHRDSKRPRGL